MREVTNHAKPWRGQFVSHNASEGIEPRNYPCRKSLNRNKAAGIDNVSREEYGRNPDENLELSVSRLKRKKYKPIAARRVYTKKRDGKASTRDIGSGEQDSRSYP